MTADETAIINSDRGEEIAVAWVYPGAVAYEWTRDTEHWSGPLPPMELWLHKRWGAGLDRAWDEVGMEPPAVFYRFQFVGPWMYNRETPYEQERMVRIALRYREVSREYGGPLRFWREFCLPRIQRASRELTGRGVDMLLHDMAELWAYAFHQTFTSLALLFEPNMQLTAMLKESAGDDAQMLALELVQSGENATQTIDREIWELAELARHTPDVASALEAASDAGVLASLRREPTASAFVTAFDAMIERHGSRSQGWDLMQSTWQERPEVPLSLVRARLHAVGPSPEEVASRSESRALDARDRALALLPPDKHPALLKTLSRLEGYVSIREDRAYWQMRLTGEVRIALLRIGALLASTGRIDAAGDVLFLEPDDIEGSNTTDLRPLVAERRREWERWHDVVPPAIIGTKSASADSPDIADSAPDELRGSAASRGVVSGIARIIAQPEDGVRLRAGDILVCAMSTPAWTPLFGIVAAIVSESGGALSHPAITAREYGIPAVVGVKGATDRIRDGQPVTVDGDRGLVVLE